MLLWFVLKATECKLIPFMVSGTTTTCALKMFRNTVVREKDSKQVNFIKMWIQGIWDCPDQDQEVGAKHINGTEMFQMTSREPMEPIVYFYFDCIMCHVSCPILFKLCTMTRDIIILAWTSIPYLKICIKNMVDRLYVE